MKSDGTPIKLPATAETIDVLETGGADQGKILRAGAISVDASGLAHLLYSVQATGTGRAILATPEKDGTWKKRSLHAFLPQHLQSWDMIIISNRILPP